MTERLERWRLVLGKEAQPELDTTLDQQALGMDRVLEALYDSERKGGLGASSPNVARWLTLHRQEYLAEFERIAEIETLGVAAEPASQQHLATV